MKLPGIHCIHCIHAKISPLVDHCRETLSKEMAQRFLGQAQLAVLLSIVSPKVGELPKLPSNEFL